MGKPHAERTGKRDELQRRFEHERLAVETDRDRRARTDLEPDLRPFQQAVEALRLADGLEHDELGDVACPGNARGDEAKPAALAR